MSSPQPPGTTLASLTTALRASWRWVAVITILGVALGLGAGFAAPPRYTAQAQLIAGATSVNAASIPSFAEAGRTLAETYSRVFRSDGVQRPLVQRFGAVAAAGATASPIPDSSVIVVEAHGDTPDEAVAIASAGADALVSTVAGLLDSNAAITTVQGRLGEALNDLVIARSLPGADGEIRTPVSLRRLADVQSAQARVDGLIAQLNKLIADSDAANGLQPLASGAITGSNQLQRLEFGGLAGLVVGGALGSLVALRRRAVTLRRARAADLVEEPVVDPAETETVDETEAVGAAPQGGSAGVDETPARRVVLHQTPLPFDVDGDGPVPAARTNGSAPEPHPAS